jgi:OOP family OmpA-OmpF porin
LDKSIGLLGHAGFGLSFLKKRSCLRKDRMGNFMAGVTGQIKLSDRVALTGDFTTILNAQDQTLTVQHMALTRFGSSFLMVLLV